MLFTLRDRELIPAPLDRVFALSTSVPVVQRTLGFTPVAGIITGHISANSRVLWRGWLFALPQHHLTRITDFAAPHTDADGNRTAYFQDTQAEGRFAFFQHNHHMLAVDDHAPQVREAAPESGRITTQPSGPMTLLQDEIRFALPFGLAGALVAKHIMLPYIRHTLRSRMTLLHHLATTLEGDPYV